MANMTTDEWLSIAIAAERLGVSTQAIRARIKRGTLEYRKNNRGKLTVRLVGNRRNDEPTALATLPTEMVTSTVAKSVDAVIENPTSSDSRIETELRRQIERLQADICAQQTRHDAELTRVQTLHLDLVGRLQAQAAAERSLWLERIDAADIRAERVEHRHQAEITLLEARHTAEIGRFAQAQAAAIKVLMDRVGAVLLANRRRPWWRWS